MNDAVVELEGLRKVYGRTVAVADLNLAIPRGALFGLLGPNGAGKSTTFGVLCGWLRQTAGTSSVLGTSSARLHTLGGRVAALPQDASFPRQVSVRSQLLHFGRLSGLSRHEAGREASRVLEAVGLPDVGSRRGHELSHGMLKRVGLAQALIGKPEVVFLDEPTSGLDPASARKIKDVIAAMVPSCTVVLSTHNLAEVQELCSHGAILDRGRLVVAGTIDDLTRRGAELTFEIREGAQLPIAELYAAFGDDAVEAQPRMLRVRFSSQEEPADAIRRALEILLAHNVAILGVHRGTTLETAFLEATSLARP
jgi:ABC-type multidrug transport system ATPase subunit